MKKLIATLIVLFIGFGTAGYFYLSGQKYVVRIPESQIQKRMDAKLPITKTYLFLFKVTLNNPQVDLVKETGRILAGLDVLVNIKLEGAKDIKGTVKASGVPKYVPKKGAFYLNEPQVEQILLKGIPDKYLDQAKELIEDVLTKYLRKNPVYKLKTDDVKHIAAKMTMKDIAVDENELVVTFGL